MSNPAERLLGMVLPDEWRVIEKVDPNPGATGGNFSVGYIVESLSGTRAFLKALDYTSALLNAPDAARALQAITEAYNFERDLHKKCNNQKMTRVVGSLSDGSVAVDPGNPASTVQYLILELAEGDVRTKMDVSRKFDLAWSLRCLHHVATGLSQLHKHDVAHQDLKPSNVLVFKNSISKVGDLGRASYRGHHPPHEDFQVPGDLSYAPPELLYGYASSDWTQRRLGCDAYLLGSMVVFFFTQLSMTSLLTMHLDVTQNWSVWKGTFADVLPYLRAAFGRAIADFEKCVKFDIRNDLVAAVRQLCDPDPKLRGHPITRARIGDPYSLERYVSQFNLLARKAELGMIGKVS